MITKPVVDGAEREFGTRIRRLRVDITTAEGRKLGASLGVDLTPTLIGFDATGNEQWRLAGRTPSRLELSRRLRRLL